jgi:formylglycine-generating enzyme required for sulfatase activity
MDKEDTQTEATAPDISRERQRQRVLKPAESFGNFRVVRCISAGLLANYYHMQHVRDLHDVTVGIFHPRTMQDSHFLERLQGLQKTFQGFTHEGIPHLRDYAEINERHCIFLDMVEGQTLSQYFAIHGSPGEVGIGIEDTTQKMALILGLLGYANVQGVDHRDLNSDLIFVKEDGTLQVLGLGIKSAIGRELFESIVSASVSPLVANKTAGRLNSFDIMSPEYRAGVSEDSRVDVYAVGVIGYWLLTAKKAGQSNWAPPSTMVNDLSGQWDDFLMKMITREVEDRYQSCKVALLGLKETGLEPQSEQVGLIQRQIDRIPVPKGILKRGEVAARVYRLSIMGLVGLLLTALAASFLNVSLMEVQKYTRDVAMVAEEGMQPDLRLHVQPPVSKIEFLKFQDRFITFAGGLDLVLQPGEYKIRVTAPHYQEKIFPVTLERRGELLEYHIELKPAWADLGINSEPGAAVSVVDEGNLEIELGVTDESGVFYLKQGILAGVYQIIVRKEGYVSYTVDNLEMVFGEMTQLEAPLIALPSSLTIRSEPAGAGVVVNAVEVGITPITLDRVEPSDDYLIELQLDGYRSTRRRIVVAAGEEKMVNFSELQPRSGELSFELTFDGAAPDEIPALMEALQVELDGKRLRFGARDLKTVPEGRHEVRLRHPFYGSELKVIDLQDREVLMVRAALSPLPGIVELVLPGSLGFEVRVNQQALDVVDSKVSLPANKLLELELRIENHLTMVRRLELNPNERIVWEIKPVAIPGPTAGQKWIMPYLSLAFAWIDPGDFIMGSPMPEHGRLPNEGPLTTVRFAAGFWIGIYEVTQSQYQEIMGLNPSGFIGPNLPVENVSWEDAKLYCRMLTDIEKAANRLPSGYAYRLPTEMEWEYAARAGSTAPFSFGDRADTSMGNFRGAYPSGSSEVVPASNQYGSVPVGSYEPNTFGVYDMHGNVKEWTLDHYNGRLRGGSLTDPAPRRDGSRIAARGGSWGDFASRVRSAARDEMRMDTRSNAVGFRVVLAPEREH